MRKTEIDRSTIDDKMNLTIDVIDTELFTDDHEVSVRYIAERNQVRNLKWL